LRETRKVCLGNSQSTSKFIALRSYANIVGIHKTAQYIINGKIYSELTWEDFDWLLANELQK